MSTELDHLLDRAERNVLLVAEGDQLRELVGKLRGDVEFYEAATARMRDQAEVATVRASRAESRVRELEAENATLRDGLAHCRHKPRIVELEAEVARLTAGQCLDSRAMCEKHHAPPVDGCPYLRCKAARNRDQRAPVAPAEHCGHQPPEVFTWLHPGQYGECVLRPGHQGSHADQHGMRWWPATEQPQASPIADGPHLFEQNPAAETVLVCRCGKWPDHHIHTGSTIACGCDTCRPAA